MYLYICYIIRGPTPFTSLTLFAQNLRFPGNLFIPPTYPRESQPGKGKEGIKLFIQPTFPFLSTHIYVYISIYVIYIYIYK